MCLAVSVRSQNPIGHTSVGCHFEEQLTFAFSLHQIHYWAWASDISDNVCLPVCVCVWRVTWACPTDILLDANGIHLRGRWRGGRARLSVGKWRLSLTCRNLCVLFSFLLFCQDTQAVLFLCEFVFFDRTVSLPLLPVFFFCCACVVCLSGPSVVCLPRACVCVGGWVWASGGQGDKGACFFPIRTPTFTSLSLFCSTSPLSNPSAISSLSVAMGLSRFPFCVPLLWIHLPVFLCSKLLLLQWWTKHKKPCSFKFIGYKKLNVKTEHKKWSVVNFVFIYSFFWTQFVLIRSQDVVAYLPKSPEPLMMFYCQF